MLIHSTFQFLWNFRVEAFETFPLVFFFFLFFCRHNNYFHMTCKGITESKRSPTPDRAACLQGLRKHYTKSLQKHLFWKKIRWNWTNKDAKKKRLVCWLQLRKISARDTVKVVRCKCKSTENQRGTNFCTCRKHGLTCVGACRVCHGVDFTYYYYISNLFHF